MAAILVAILDNVMDPSNAITHDINLYFLEHIIGYLLGVKYFRNIVTPQGRGCTSPASFLYHGGGLSLRARPRIKRI